MFVPDASSSTMTPEAGVDAGPTSLFLNCGISVCPLGDAGAHCCQTPTSAQNQFTCTLGGGTCNTPCDTRLDCTSNENCPSRTPLCCVGPMAAAATCSGNKSYVSSCKVACGPLETTFCSASSGCPSNKTCSNSGSDLAAFGLSSVSGYSICK